MVLMRAENELLRVSPHYLLPESVEATEGAGRGRGEYDPEEPN